MQHGPTLSDGLAIQASVMKRGWQLHRLDQALMLGEAMFEIERSGGRVTEFTEIKPGLVRVEYLPPCSGFYEEMLAALDWVPCK